MISFSIKFQPGIPVYEQVIYAVKKAIVSKQLKSGDSFPSVRELSRELKINPNTAQKAVAYLVREKLLVIKPGVGSIVGQLNEGTEVQRQEILEQEIEKIVVESKRLLINKKDVIAAITRHWDIKGKDKK